MNILCRNISLMTLLFAMSCGGTSVQGGSEFGNPGGTRNVTGTVSSEVLSSLQTQSGSCAADTIIATDTAATATSSSLNSSCAFTLTLAVGKAYSVALSSGDTFVASFIFNNNPNTLADNFMVVSDGTTPIDLGQITITNGTASPANEPAEQNDQDGDGTNDFDDDDDDNDGTSDEDETDCDLDGAHDDIDEDDDCDVEEDSESDSDDDDSEDQSDEAAVVLEVEPPNGKGIDDPDEAVDLDADVEVRVSCIVDESTVTSSTFRITSGDDVLSCEIETGDSSKDFSCDHDGNFLADRTYTATIDGVKCEDGRDVQVTTWNWKTGDDD